MTSEACTNILCKENINGINIQLNKQIFSVCGEDSILLRSHFFANLIYRFSAIPIQFPACSFVDIGKVVIPVMWRGKRPRIATTILKNKVGELTRPDSKIYYRTTVIKTVWYQKRIDTQISGTEQKSQKQKPVNIVN